MKEKILEYIKLNKNVSYKEINDVFGIYHVDKALKSLLKEQKIKKVQMVSDSPQVRGTFSDYKGYGIEGYKISNKCNAVINKIV